MSATRVHHTPTTDEEWDGPATETSLREDTPSKMKQLFAWFDADKPESKTAHKFPHHEVTRGSRIGAANVRACINGISILNGGRGGADIPKSDRSKIYRHLAAHLKDARREPAELKK